MDKAVLDRATIPLQPGKEEVDKNMVVRDTILEDREKVDKNTIQVGKEEVGRVTILRTRRRWTGILSR